jgi:hypothetical protein
MLCARSHERRLNYATPVFSAVGARPLLATSGMRARIPTFVQLDLVGILGRDKDPGAKLKRSNLQPKEKREFKR